MIHESCPDLLKPFRLVCLDLETTGLNIKYNTIIELGVIEIVNGKVKLEYSKLFGGGHSSMFLVRKVHHISDAERCGKPTFKECAEKIAGYLSDAVIITHNGNSFDLPMIREKLSEAGFPLRIRKSIDTLQLVRKMRRASKRKNDGNDDDEEERKSNALGALCKEFGLVYGGEDGDRSHRGLEDAEATVDLLFHLVNHNLVDLAI